MERLVVEEGGAVVLPQSVLQRIGMSGPGLVRIIAHGKEIVIEKSHLQVPGRESRS